MLGAAATEARNDARQVVVDPHARYFGAELGEGSLIPGAGARLGEVRFQEWLTQSAPGTSAAAGR